MISGNGVEGTPGYAGSIEGVGVDAPICVADGCGVGDVLETIEGAGYADLGVRVCESDASVSPAVGDAPLTETAITTRPITRRDKIAVSRTLPARIADRDFITASGKHLDEQSSEVFLVGYNKVANGKLCSGTPLIANEHQIIYLP